MSLLRAQPDATKRSYVSTGLFTEFFLSYSTSTNGNGVTTGSLSAVTTNDLLCPPGRILRENGKKLYKDANPGVNKYYVGVYDAVTSLRGYIDPNEKVFALYNSDKPTYLADSIDSNDLPDIGNPVYTRGDITTTDGSIISENYGANEFRAVGMVDGGNEVTDPSYGLAYYSTIPPLGVALEAGVVTGPGPREDVYAGLYGGDGSIWYTGLINPINSSGDIQLASGVSTVTNEIFTSNPRVFLSLKTPAPGGSTMGNTYKYAIAASTLTVTAIATNGSTVATDNSVVNWFAVGTGS